ncbi:MAG: hypothetical protein IT428_08065 [Planctomycetaceae bacterium]|nr:hypothetical protein [Planctomycetaceae bacterium]
MLFQRLPSILSSPTRLGFRDRCLMCAGLAALGIGLATLGSLAVAANPQKDGVNPGPAAAAKGHPKAASKSEMTEEERDVYKALRTEFEADAGDREALLDDVVERDPGFAPARWARGEVRFKDRWIRFEDFPAEVKSAAWTAYREARKQADSSPGSQLKLADLCRKSKLPEQERGHLRQVVRSEPDHAAARKRLGEVKVDEGWLSKADYERRKAHTKAVAEILKQSKVALTRISLQLKSGDMTPQEALDELKELDRVEHIPALELYLSTPDATGAKVVVQCLSAQPSADASLSLVRHAMGHPSDDVRKAAVQSLRKRDWFGFVPQLLATLQSPVLTREALVNLGSGQILWRQVFYADKQDSQQLGVLDNVFHLQGDVYGASYPAWLMYRNEAALRNRSLDQVNQSILASNERVSSLLTQVTGQLQAKSPDAWWKWWQDQNETVSVKPKGFKKKHNVSHLMCVQTMDNTPKERIIGMRDMMSCLAPGTEIWTDAGPVAVELIRTGDLVLSQHPETGELAYKAVVEPTQRPPAVLLKITLEDDERIRATGGHNFWVSGHGWLKARSLKKGMALHTPRGTVKVVDVKEEESQTKAFNLVVSYFHTYFVGNKRVYSYDNTERQPSLVAVPGLLED